MKTLNLVMIVKNEERCLERCLKSVKNLVDRMIVVDTGSTDRTKEIANQWGASIYDWNWNGDFSLARNFALQQSDSDWNLILDADEYCSQGSREELEPFLQNQEQLGVVEIRNAYEENGEISYGISCITRLLPKGVLFQGKIHEQVESSLPRRATTMVFDHDGYLQQGKGERNLPLLLQALKESPKDSYYLYQVASTMRNMKRDQEALPYFAQFCRYAVPDDNYFNRGMVAYLYSLLECGRFEEGLQLIASYQNFLKPFADYWFACGMFYMKLVLSDTSRYLSYLPQIEASYLQCLKIGEKPEQGGVWGNGSFRAFYNLGTWYEVSGNTEKALECYRTSAKENYQPAKERLKALEI